MWSSSAAMFRVALLCLLALMAHGWQDISGEDGRFFISAPTGVQIAFRCFSHEERCTSFKVFKTGEELPYEGIDQTLREVITGKPGIHELEIDENPGHIVYQSRDLQLAGKLVSTFDEILTPLLFKPPKLSTEGKVYVTSDKAVILTNFDEDSYGAYHCQCDISKSSFDVSPPIQLFPAVDREFSLSTPSLERVNGSFYVLCPPWRGADVVMEMWVDDTDVLSRAPISPSYAHLFPLVRTGSYRCVANGAFGVEKSKPLTVGVADAAARYRNRFAPPPCPSAAQPSWLLRHWPAVAITFSLCLICIVVTTWLIHCVGSGRCYAGTRKVHDSHSTLVMPHVPQPSFVHSYPAIG